MIKTNEGYIIIGKQAAKGSATTPTVIIPFLDEGFNVGHNVTILNEGQDNNYKSVNIKTMHSENFSFSCYARPNYTSYLLGWFLGDSAVVGGADPYTHTLTRDERAWLTIRRKLDTSVVHELYDSKIDKISIEGVSGQPLKLMVSGKACNADIIATENVIAYEDRNPFTFFNGEGRFKFATTADRLIKDFNISLSIDNGELVDDEFQVADLVDMDYNADITANFFTEDTARWKKVTYDSSTVPQENVYTGAFEIDCQYLQTSTRQLKVEIPLIKYEPVNINLSGLAQIMTEGVAGVAEKQATTELVTITCMNNIATTII